MNTAGSRRILVVDDVSGIHDDFRKILAPRAAAPASIEAALFGEPAAAPAQEGFEVDFALQGQQGLALLEQALAAGRPYALAFVDMRMPPGWDGVETIERLWQADPQLQVVVCTAYSDHPWEEVMGRLDVGDRLLVLKKPFDMIEVAQLARSLTAKWDLARRARSLLEGLEEAVRARTAELALARDAAEAASRAKSEFMANMTHELRTPLNGILGLLHLAQRTPLTPQQRDYLDKAGGSGRRLLDVINDVLDFSAAEAGTIALRPQPFALDALLEDLAASLLDKSGAKGLLLAFDVAPDLPARLAGDAARLRQVLDKLCDNAVKFTPSGEVTVAVRVAREHQGRTLLRFEVRDAGIGIDAAHAARLFRGFEQLDASATRSHGGAGLGLAIAARLVALMGGEIGMSSTPGQGSTFWFTAWLDGPAGTLSEPVR